MRGSAYVKLARRVVAKRSGTRVLRCRELIDEQRQGMAMADKTVSVVDRSHDRPGALLLTLGTSAALVAGACTPSPQPTPAGSVSAPTSAPTSATTTSTAISTPTTAGPTTDHGIPVAAQVDSIEGAQEFVTYFLVQLDRSWAEPNPALLVPLCSAQSKTCQDYIYTAQEFQSNGWRYQGGTFASTSIVARSWMSGSATVLARGSQPTGKIVDSNGSTVRNVAAVNGGLVFDLSMVGSWTVQSIKAERKPT